MARKNVLKVNQGPESGDLDVKNVENIEMSDDVSSKNKLEIAPDKPQVMTLYNAYRRMAFSDDPKENLMIYNKKRRGYEGKEKSVLVKIN